MDFLTDTKPSDFQADPSFNQYTSTFKKIEMEISMLAIVYAAQRMGDAWEPQFLAKILDGPVRAEAERCVKHHKPCIWLVPIVHFDFNGLVREGYAEWHGTSPVQKIGVTDVGIAMLVAKGWTNVEYDAWKESARLVLFQSANQKIADSVIAGGRRR
jgi:hypothetical protein